VGGTVLGVGRGEQVYPLEDLAATGCVVVTPEVGVSTARAFAEWDRSGPVAKAGLAALGRTAEAAVPTQISTQIPTQISTKISTKISTRTLTKISTKNRAAQSKGGELTVPVASDRMGELGRELSAWLSASSTGAPRGQRGRAENPLLELVRAGIKNDFEEVVFPEYPELSEGKSALERAGAKYASLSGSGSSLYGLFASQEAARRAVTSLRRQGWAAQASVTLTRRAYWKRMES